MMTAMMMATATMMPRTAVLTMMTSPAALLPSPLLTYFYLPLENPNLPKQGDTITMMTQTLFVRIILPKELRPLPCQGKKIVLG